MCHVATFLLELGPGGVLIRLVLILGIYFLPTIIGRNKRSANAIFALNLLLGWTILGWIGALVWSLTADPPETQVIAAKRQPPPILCATCGKYSAPGSQFCNSCGGQFL